MDGEPFHPTQARRLIHAVLKTGTVRFSKHALEQMPKRDLTTVDCVNVLRGGVVEPPELDKGTWRYCVRTARIHVVVACRSAMELVVVTTWRVER